MKNKIIVIGSANIDMVIKTEKFPAPGETIIGGDFLQSQGGKGANQAVAAARLGGTVDFIARVGNDDFGTQAIQQYKKDGIGVTNIKVDKNSHTGVALISVNKGGENKIIVAPGANNGFTAEDIENTVKLISEADILLIQLEIPLETVGQIIKLANKFDTKVILNPAPATVLPVAYFQELFLITPNKAEAEQLTNMSINGTDSMLRVASKLQAFGVKNVAITLGSDGVYLLTEEFQGIISTPKVNVIDTTAAGDVFNGAMAVALTNGKNWENSVRFACNAAAVSVTKNGAQNSAPTIEEINAFNFKTI